MKVSMTGKEKGNILIQVTALNRGDPMDRFDYTVFLILLVVICIIIF